MHKLTSLPTCNWALNPLTLASLYIPNSNMPNTTSNINQSSKATYLLKYLNNVPIYTFWKSYNWKIRIVFLCIFTVVHMGMLLSLYCSPHLVSKSWSKTDKIPLHFVLVVYHQALYLRVHITKITVHCDWLYVTMIN